MAHRQQKYTKNYRQTRHVQMFLFHASAAFMQAIFLINMRVYCLLSDK